MKQKNDDNVLIDGDFILIIMLSYLVTLKAYPMNVQVTLVLVSKMLTRSLSDGSRFVVSLQLLNLFLFTDNLIIISTL